MSQNFQYNIFCKITDNGGDRVKTIYFYSMAIFRDLVMQTSFNVIIAGKVHLHYQALRQVTAIMQWLVFGLQKLFYFTCIISAGG